MGAHKRNAGDIRRPIRNPVRSSHKFEDFRQRRVLYLSLGGRLNGTPTSNPDKLLLSSRRPSFSWFSSVLHELCQLPGVLRNKSRPDLVAVFPS